MQTLTLSRLDLGSARTFTRDSLPGIYVEMLVFPSRTPIG